MLRVFVAPIVLLALGIVCLGGALMWQLIPHPADHHYGNTWGVPVLFGLFAVFVTSALAVFISVYRVR